jgi:hypothetical protein
MKNYEQDFFKAGAAQTLGKDYEDVTLLERVAFKTSMFNVLRSKKFRDGQADYVRDALMQQDRDYALMEHMEKFVCCLKCGSKVDMAAVHRDNYTFWCAMCDKDLVLTLSECLGILKNKDDYTAFRTSRGTS